MEDVLDLYSEQAYHPERPVVCFDETSTAVDWLMCAHRIRGCTTRSGGDARTTEYPA